jgi:hypothetical protein
MIGRVRRRSCGCAESCSAPDEEETMVAAAAPRAAAGVGAAMLIFIWIYMSRRPEVRRALPNGNRRKNNNGSSCTRKSRPKRPRPTANHDRPPAARNRFTKA